MFWRGYSWWSPFFFPLIFNYFSLNSSTWQDISLPSPEGMTEAPVWLSQCFSHSCTASFAFLPLLFLLFFLSSWDWLTEDLCCEAHLQHGRVIVSLWQRSFCLQQVRMCWCKQQAVCNSYSTSFEGPYQSPSLCDTYKRGHEAGLWKGNTEDFWACARPQWSPSEGPSVLSLSFPVGTWSTMG